MGNLLSSLLKGFCNLAGEEENQIMLPIHEMKVQLPLENWYDLLALVPRRQLGNIASQIGDCQFAHILQSFLHEHGNITLGSMEIIPPRRNVPSDRPMVQDDDEEFPAVDLADWSMPENVKNFKVIYTNYVDMRVLDFLREFQNNSLLANVNLDLSSGHRDGELDHQVPILNKILPLISSIHSISFGDLFYWLYNCDNRVLLERMVAQTKILSVDWCTHNSDRTVQNQIDWCCSWLYTPRDDGMPRALISGFWLNETDRFSFIDRIKKDFEEANHAVSFFIRFIVPTNYQLQEISLNNDKTNENLVVKAVPEGHLVLISRHSSEAAKHKIEEDEKEISEWNPDRVDKRIYLTIT